MHNWGWPIPTNFCMLSVGLDENLFLKVFQKSKIFDIFWFSIKNFLKFFESLKTMFLLNKLVLFVFWSKIIPPKPIFILKLARNWPCGPFLARYRVGKISQGPNGFFQPKLFLGQRKSTHQILFWFDKYFFGFIYWLKVKNTQISKKLVGSEKFE